MPVDRARILRLLGYNRTYIEDLAAGIAGKYAAYFRGLFENLHRGPRWERELEPRLRAMPTLERIGYLRRIVDRLSDIVRWGTRSARGYARVLIWEFDVRAEIATFRGEIEARLPRLIDEELLHHAISLKERERDFLRDLAVAFREVELPRWAERVDDYLGRVERWLEELRRMLVVLFRVHKSRMFYRSYRARETPQPFAMLSLFTITREPDKYTEELFDSGLDFLMEDPRAFPTLGMALYSASKAALRRGFAPPGAYFEVEGIEKEPIDVDEIAPLKLEEVLDILRYYVALYRIIGGVPEIYREYIGRIEETPVGWEIYPEEPGYVWKKTETLNWPEELEV